MPKSRALPEVARTTYTQKRQVASATFTYAGAKSRPESQKVCNQNSRARLLSARARESSFERQKVCQRKSRARHPSARARKAFLRDRDIWSRSRERDLFPRERESRFPGDVIAAFSSEIHIFPCKGRGSSQEKSPQAPFGQPIITKTTITLLLYK
ncbi:hypothetical protein JCGZ_23681 [Jatropha curcas]|uniref:Uncharacterized protein n=1 Tax=Jatropha curcas TaxID=180498 RepID=A0A067L2S3_JATCU|nr:hypothetical protein JCGZ_23681 [Jatropha curcas]